MANKKGLTVILALVAIVAIILCIVFGTQPKKTDEDTKALEGIPDLKTQIADLTTKLTDAEDAAKKAAEDAATELETKVAEAAATAKKEAEDAAAVDLKTKVEEAVAAAKKEAEDLAATAKTAADKVKTDLETQVADLQTKLSDAEAAAKKAAEDAAADLETKVAEAAATAKKEAEDAAAADLQTKIDEAVDAAKKDWEDTAKKAGEDAAIELQTKIDDAVAAAKKEAEDAAAKVKEETDKVQKDLEDQVADLTKKLKDTEDAAKKAADDAKAKLDEAEAKVADLEKQIADAAEAAKEQVTETVEEVKEETANAVEEVKEEVKEEAPAEEPKEEAPAAEPAPAEETLMSHEQYISAELDTAVCIETYVQATQSWWDNKITVYAQSPDGAYFIYNMACSQEDAAKLVPGTKIHVDGFKSEWAGEVEITDATFSIMEGEEPFIAEALDMEGIAGTDDLILHQNERVIFKGLTVAEYVDMDGNATGTAFAYKNAENKTDDLYFKAVKGDQEINFCVEFYLCNNETDVYKAVEGLQIGDVVDIEAYLYWYNNANPHVIGVTKAE